MQLPTYLARFQLKATTTRLTVFYVLALVTVGLLSIGGQFLVQYTIRLQSNDSRLVNVAGRQRMLSQAITKLALLLQEETGPAGRQRRTSELRSALETWERTHQGLRSGDAALYLTGRNSKTVQQLFEEVAPHYEAMVFATRQILAAQPGRQPIEIFVERLLNHEEFFLQGMEALVARYEWEAEERVDVLLRLELFLLGLTLLVLILEGLFVFRPTAERIRRTIAALADAQVELRAEKELVEVTLGSIGDGVITTDAHACVLTLNPVAEQLTGWQSEAARGQSIHTIFPILNEKTRQVVANPIDCALAEGRIAMLPRDTLLVAQDGSEIAIDDSAAPIRDGEGRIVGAVLVFRDVTTERELGRQLTWQASHDPLTGLINRREFEHRVTLICQGAVGKDQPHALCYLDLDRFKTVNDACGHRAGDALLRQISLLLEREVRPGDTVARLGGDEFGVLLRDCSFEQAAAIAERLLGAIRHLNFCWDGQCFLIGASLGLAPIRSVCRLEEVIHAADIACYASKHQGRDRVSHAAVTL